MSNTATPKQVRYLTYLLAENGYPTEFMNASFKKLGATMRERSGSVSAWLEGMSCVRASALIKSLQN